MAPLTVIPGARPLVLVAPHGGRRDPEKRPWASGHLRMNDLHTATLSAELAALIGATALINAEHDRNDVDLNRISEADERAPWFLDRLAEVLGAVLARSERATLFAMHGWNVVQPVVDLGLGCAPKANPFEVGRAAAVAPAFAAAALPRLVGACAARGIGATVGARYPARNRENLLQLFTPRYRDDPRPRVRALAAFAPRVDAVQLELGIAVRWPGTWRERLLDACREALPALLAAPGIDAPPPAPPAVGEIARAVPRRLEFTGPVLCGLVGIDPGHMGRLLLFPPHGGLALFTGERIGLEPVAVTGALAVRPTPDGGLAVRFEGPLLHFPDTTPFLDLEAGLARARLVEAELELVFVPHHTGLGTAEFGAVEGRVVLDHVSYAISAAGFAESGGTAAPWPRLRAAVRLSESTSLAVTVGLDGGAASGFLCRDGRHIAITAAHASIGRADAPLERVTVELELAGGERLALAARAIHRLPVIRARGDAPIRIEFAACRLEERSGVDPWPAGWFEAGGL